MPILRGSPRTVSVVKEKEPKQSSETKRETRSSKSPAACASSRLKDFKTSTKLSRAEIRSSAAARLSQRNQKKAEKEGKSSDVEHGGERDSKTKNPLSIKQGSSSSTKSSGTPCSDSQVETHLDESCEKNSSLKEDHENCKKKRQKFSQEHGSGKSDEERIEDKGEGHRKRKQSLEKVKSENDKYRPTKKRKKLTIFEYVVEEVPSNTQKESESEAADEETGGRRRSKRASIPNTMYYKNFIDPSQKIPKLSNLEESIIGSNKSGNKDKEQETRAKKSAARPQKGGKFEANRTEKLEVIKWEMDESGLVLNRTVHTENSAEERESEEESTDTTDQTDAGQTTHSKALAGKEDDGSKNRDRETVELGPTEQTVSDNRSYSVVDSSYFMAKSSVVRSQILFPKADLIPQENCAESKTEKSSEKQVKENLGKGTSRSEKRTDLDITEMSVVYVDRNGNIGTNDSTQLGSRNHEADNCEISTEAIIEGSSDTCIEIQGVTEEVNISDISGGDQTSEDVYTIGRGALSRERPGRICRQETEEMEEAENQMTGIETQKEKNAGTPNVLQNSEEGTKKSQGTVTVQIINSKAKKVQMFDMSVQADDLSENEEEPESSQQSDESSTEIQKSSTVISMPDGRSVTVASADKPPFTFRTVSKTDISKQASSTGASDVKRITLPSGATGLKILKGMPQGALVKFKPAVISLDGEVISEDVSLDDVQKTQEAWNAVYKSSQVDNQEIILVSLPEGQELKEKLPFKQKKPDEVAYEMNEEGEFVCGVCNYKTSRKSNWYKHRKKHMGRKTHKCELCDYVAATSSNLKRHQNIHLDVREHQCNQCGQTFRQKIHLERHIKYKHEEKAVKCPLCDYVCANENPDLKVHIKRRHIPVEDDEAKEAKSYTCAECGLMTYSKRDMRQHMKFHKSGPELKLFCEQCSFVTDCESRLRRHVLIHSNERPYQCGLCDYRGSQKEHVLRHMKTQHHIAVERRSSRKGPDMEDSDSKDSSSVDKQQDKSDYSSQEKIFACNHCSMKFSKLINLYKHLHGQHKDVLPQDSEEFLCVVCDFRTSSKKNLLVHMRKHNLIDQVPPSHVYSCVLCRYMNPRRRNLFQHMKKKHNIEIVIRDDGSTSCFVTESLPASEDSVSNMLTVGDIVTAETEESSELQIVTDNSNSTQSVISIEDLAYAVSHPKPNTRLLKEGTMKPRIATVVKEHEAAEAIEGLQALAGQRGIAHFTLDPHKSDSMETEVITMENPGEIMEDRDAEKEPGYQLSHDQLMNLSTGDFVEINGEMYKVEISSEENPSSSQIDSVQAGITQADVGLSEVANGTSHVTMSDVGNGHLEVSLVKETPSTEHQILNPQSNSSGATVAVTQPSDIQMEVTQLHKSEGELKDPNRVEFPETKAESMERTAEIPITETCIQPETSEGDLTDRDQGMTTIEEVFMHVESGNIIGSGHAPSSQSMSSERIITSEILGIQQSDPIDAPQGTFSSIDQEGVNNAESNKVDDAAADQITESSVIAEFSSTLSELPGENNSSQITESVLAENTHTENSQDAIAEFSSTLSEGPGENSSSQITESVLAENTHPENSQEVIAEFSSNLSEGPGENSSQITESVFAENTHPENSQETIAEFSSTLSEGPGENSSSQITESVFAENAHPENSQQMSMEIGNPEALESSS
ncbi:uncharacterized protein LOC134267140 isoform X2 [Saccostrea cucullata]|uniref:uncharacterized protein LOC134267140 isoform X2 n=1 Tax=Saccostrea cuccullata TaxID=36930 RepID=UPI002ED6614A